jgi:hypothetical protein
MSTFHQRRNNARMKTQVTSVSYSIDGSLIATATTGIGLNYKFFLYISPFFNIY